MWIWVDRETKRRALEGKATDVFLHQKPLSREKVAKEIARNVTFTNSLANLEVPTPEGITVATPAAGDAGRHEETAGIRPLPLLQLQDEVWSLVTEIVCSARVEEVPQYLSASDVYHGIFYGEINRSLWMWPEARLLEMNLDAYPSITHSTRQALERMGTLLCFAINNRVSWRELYNIFQPFINDRTHDLLGSICRSKTTSTRILCRLILYGAVDTADILVAQKILESGIKITSHDGLMTLAFRTRNPKLVELLCKREVPLEISEYPPDIFSKEEDVQMLRLLLEAGVDPERIIEDEMAGFRLLQTAERGYLEPVQLIVEHGAECLYNPSKHGSVLQAATARGHCGLVGLLQSLTRPYLFLPNNSKDRPLLDKFFQDLHCDVSLAMQEVARGPNQIAAANNNLEMAGADSDVMPAPMGGLTTLQAAATGGYADITTRLLALGAGDESLAPQGGPTSLQAVIRHRNQALLEAVVNNGANINSPPSESSGTALQEAVKYRWFDGARYLLSRGADVNARPHSAASFGHDLTALGWAIQNDDLAMTDMLLKCGADVGCAQDSACSSPTALLFALHRGKSPNVIDLLFRPADNISSWQVAESALIAAINSHYSLTPVYKMILSNMPTISFLPEFFVQKACRRAWDEIMLSDYLCPSKEMDQIEVIDLLLTKGAPINALSPREMVNCLQVALHRGCQQIAKFLLQRGASPDMAATADIATPLQEAIDRGYFDIIGIILKQDVNVNAAPIRRNGRTALQMAARDGLFGLAFKLLELGADVAAPPAEEGGRTAIDCAAENGRIDMVQLLLNAYKGDEAIGDVCERAAGYAENQGHVEIAEWLREYPS
ncbi:ankyrin repeat-containing domain protein [Aspergillus pseudodeflectus]|uniref:Ankyrin repeat-containing domain protein n=1 Tax=Aspergillus pseudodeflectus TaxID=176178 RepID=A0ABR4KV24_9EURO